VSKINAVEAVHFVNYGHCEKTVTSYFQAIMKMHYEARELNSYAEPVDPGSLQEGNIYFSVQFVDDEMLIPVMETWVFVGKGLEPEVDSDFFFFQDIGSYNEGIRYESATGDEANFQVAKADGMKHIFEYEKALEVLMKCSLRRRNGR
jgi:hypothetical protein